MHNAVILRKENSRLRDENTRRKKKQAYRRAFIQTGGTLIIEEGITRTEARQKRRGNQGAHQEAEGEHPAVEVPPQAAVETTAPITRKRAQPKCSVCGSIEHNARTCPCT